MGGREITILKIQDNFVQLKDMTVDTVEAEHPPPHQGLKHIVIRFCKREGKEKFLLPRGRHNVHVRGRESGPIQQL